MHSADRQRLSLKTLVCIINQVRAAELTWPSFKRYVLDELDADLCLAVGMDEDCLAKNPNVANAQYIFSSREWQDWSLAFDLAQKCIIDSSTPPNWREVFTLGGQWLGPMGAQEGSGGIGIFFRWWLLHHIAKLDYDRFVIARSDMLWLAPHPPMDLLDPAKVWVPNGEHYGGYNDRHAILSKQNLVVGLNHIEDIVLRPQELIEEIKEAKLAGLNCESYWKFHLQKNHIGVGFFPYVMFAVRGEHGKTRWAAGKYDPKLGYAIKYPWERQTALQYANDIKTRDDWRKFL